MDEESAPITYSGAIDVSPDEHVSFFVESVDCLDQCTSPSISPSVEPEVHSKRGRYFEEEDDGAASPVQDNCESVNMDIVEEGGETQEFDSYVGLSAVY